MPGPTDLPERGAVCVGITVLDVVQRVPSEPRWGVKSVADSVEIAAGGPSANAAVTAAALLGTATLVTALGESPQAQLARNDLVRHRVQIVDCAPEGWILPVATCLVDQTGERTVVSTGATDSPVELTAEGRAVVRAAAGILVDGHHPRAAREALSIRADRCVAVLDAGSAKAHVEPWLPDLDVVAGSADYAKGLGLDLAAALQHVLDEGAAVGVMTDGGDPLCWATRTEREPHWLAPPTVTVHDTLGAGDAFHGALLAAAVAELPNRGAVELAAATASRRVSSTGARAWLTGLRPLI